MSNETHIRRVVPIIENLDLLGGISHTNAKKISKFANMNKYCKYHRNNGHTTKECATLRDKVEELVQVGHLKRFLRCDDERSLCSGFRRSNDGRDDRKDREKE